MSWLTSLPLGGLIAGCLVLSFALAFTGRFLARRFLDDGHRDRGLSVAAGIMSPLGAGFAILAALTLANAAQHLSNAESIVSSEAGDASRLAWAATTNGVGTDAIHIDLGKYLQAIRAYEWHGKQAANGDDPQTAAAIARLERTVRTAATAPGTTTPVSTELLSSVDALTTDRRERLAAASTQLPNVYIVILAISGAVLLLNAGVLTVSSHRRAFPIIGGLTLVIGLSISLILGLATPWQGPVSVSGHPIDDVISDLQSGYFHTQ